MCALCSKLLKFLWVNIEDGEFPIELAREAREKPFPIAFMMYSPQIVTSSEPVNQDLIHHGSLHYNGIRIPHDETNNSEITYFDWLSSP